MIKNDRSYILVGLYIFGVMVAELMGGKTFSLIHISGLTANASVAIFVVPLLFSVTDIVTEVYGRKEARKLVRLGLMIICLQLLAALLFTALPASQRYQPNEAAYNSIFGTSIRFAAASLVAFAVSELLDVAIFSRMKQRLERYGLWLRNNVSNIVSQFVDSAVFLTIAFYAFGQSAGSNIHFILGLLIPYWLIRCLCSLFETPLVYIGVKWLRRGEITTVN
jgi:uncharacterized integral membrane protein (TIGR00697 family)